MALGALAVTVPACERADSTGPPASAPAALGLTREQGRVLSVTVQDVRTRLLPVLGAAGEELGGALDRLDAAVAAQDRVAFVGALSRADGVLSRLPQDTQDEAAADVDAIRLLLDEARALAAAPAAIDR